MNHKIIIIFLLTFFCFICNDIYAYKNICPNDSVHCAYFNSNFTEGRWIKIIGTINFIYCFKQNNYVSVFPEAAKSRLGWNSDQYYICADGNGKNCEQIGIDNFNISTKDNSYFSDPKYYSIAISQFDNKY